MHISFMQREALRFEVQSLSNNDAAEISPGGSDDARTNRHKFEEDNSEDNSNEDGDDESQDRSY